MVALAIVGRGLLSARSRAARAGHGAGTRPVNLGPVINTRHREAERSFTADGRTMHFNGNDWGQVFHTALTLYLFSRGHNVGTPDPPVHPLPLRYVAEVHELPDC